MGLDVAIVCVLVLFAVFGAMSGAARQIANVLALVLAYLAAGPVARQISPALARQFGGSEFMATAVGTLLVFIAVWILGRLMLGEGLERLIEGDRGEQADVNRAFGAVLGAVKAAIVVWVLLSALTFAERHVHLGNKRIDLPARDSTALAITRKYNLFDLTPDRPTHELAPRRYADDPAWQKLRTDPRFREVFKDPKVRRAFESGDYRAFVESDAVKRLLKDPALAAHLEKIERAADQ